jgi:uncharacterized protein (DUF342 family)
MDEEILEELALFQEKIEEISMKFKNLKDITYKLYKENEELKNEVLLAFSWSKIGLITRKTLFNL